MDKYYLIGYAAGNDKVRAAGVDGVHGIHQDKGIMRVIVEG